MHESLAIILAACERLGHELREANQSAAANASADVKSPPAFMVGAPSRRSQNVTAGKLSDNIVRFGLSYKFDPFIAPAYAVTK